MRRGRRVRRGRDRCRHGRSGRRDPPGAERRKRVRARQGRRFDAPGARHDRRARLRARAVDSPARAARRRSSRRASRSPLRAARPTGVVAEALRLVSRDRARRAVCRATRYIGSLERNLLLPDRRGRAQALGRGAEDVRRRGRAGARPGLPSSACRRCATSTPGCAPANLRPPVSTRSRCSVDIELDRADANAVGIARRSTTPAGAPSSAPGCRRSLGAGSRSALPAMLGLRDPTPVLADLEERLGRRVFEIPTLPPSVPGMRLFEILRSTPSRAAGGRLVFGAERGRARARRATGSFRSTRPPPVERRLLRRRRVRARLGRLPFGRDRARLALGRRGAAVWACSWLASQAPASRASSHPTSTSSRSPVPEWRSIRAARQGSRERGRRRRLAARRRRRGARRPARASRWPAATARRRS